jgi:multidrug resistance efflux pump
MAATEEQVVTVPPAPAETLQDTRDAKAENLVTRVRNHPWFRAVLAVLIVLAAIGGILYWEDLQSKIYVENAQITAPVISIGPSSPGIINEIDVAVGDTVRKDQVLAKVGNEVLLSKTHGVITGVENTPGQLVTPGLDPKPVISMIDTRQLRVTGQVQEDKGLKDILPGQYVEFTVDAFPDSRYAGVVEKIAPAARVGDIVFSISDKRQEQDFDVTVIYDVNAYPELKDGMSAKMWIFK